MCPCITCTELDVQKLLVPSFIAQNSDPNAPCRAQSTQHGAQSSEYRAQSSEHRAQITEHRAQSTANGALITED